MGIVSGLNANKFLPPELSPIIIGPLENIQTLPRHAGINSLVRATIPKQSDVLDSYGVNVALHHELQKLS